MIAESVLNAMVSSYAVGEQLIQYPSLRKEHRG